MSLFEKWDSIINGMFEYYNKKENYTDENWKLTCEYMYAFKCYMKNNNTDLLELLIDDISQHSLYREYKQKTQTSNREESLTTKE